MQHYGLFKNGNILLKKFIFSTLNMCTFQEILSHKIYHCYCFSGWNYDFFLKDIQDLTTISYTSTIHIKISYDKATEWNYNSMQTNDSHKVRAKNARTTNYKKIFTKQGHEIWMWMHAKKCKGNLFIVYLIYFTQERSSDYEIWRHIKKEIKQRWSGHCA